MLRDRKHEERQALLDAMVNECRRVGEHRRLRGPDVALLAGSKPELSTSSPQSRPTEPFAGTDATK
jgi:hypothetical protein